MIDATSSDRIRKYIVDNFLYMRPELSLTPETSLLDQGIIDSMGVAELVTFLEEEFSITVDDEAITEDNFGTLAAIASYVDSRRAGRATASA